MSVVLEQEEVARAGQYALFSNLLYVPPTSALLDALAQDDGRLGLASKAMDFDAAQDEFQALFVGAGSGGEVIPYASWHLTGFLMEEPLAYLRVDLENLGFDRMAGVNEPEDHIAALCETMRLLIESGKPLLRQKQFFMRHIAPWGEQFAAQLEAAPSANYYRVVAAQLKEFLHVEAMAFDMLENQGDVHA